MRFLITYTGERFKSRLQEIGSLEELLALYDVEMAKQPEDARGIILLCIDKEDGYPGAPLKKLPRGQWPEFKIEVYDDYRE